MHLRKNRVSRIYNPTERNQRTTTGEAICNSCHRVGHIARNCRGSLRDPRIPQKNHFVNRKSNLKPGSSFLDAHNHLLRTLIK